MATFRATLIKHLNEGHSDGWAVQRTDPDGLQIVVTRLYETEQDAANEAARLTREAARGRMGQL
jgi:hypothetical protein